VKRALALAEAPRSAGVLEVLRRRLAGAGGASRDAVLLDFLEDELVESRRALGALEHYLSRVGTALHDPVNARHQILALASASRPAREIEYLEATLHRLRRRLAQVSERLAAAR
jgi:hypothetical protein